MRVFHLDQVCALLHQKVERIEVAQERGQVGRGPTLENNYKGIYIHLGFGDL